MVQALAQDSDEDTQPKSDNSDSLGEDSQIPASRENTGAFIGPVVKDYGSQKNEELLLAVYNPLNQQPSDVVTNDTCYDDLDGVVIYDTQL